MKCKDCIWEKTIRPVAMLAFTCKGVDEVVYVDVDFNCKSFEHKDFPKGVNYGADI